MGLGEAMHSCVSFCTLAQFAGMPRGFLCYQDRALQDIGERKIKIVPSEGTEVQHQHPSPPQKTHISCMCVTDDSMHVCRVEPLAHVFLFCPTLVFNTLAYLANSNHLTYQIIKLLVPVEFQGPQIGQREEKGSPHLPPPSPICTLQWRCE